LVGINGSGKTTLLNLIEDVFIAKNNLINDTNSQLIVEFDTNEIIESKSNFGNFQIIENFNKLSTFDVQIGDKNKKGRETTTDLNDMLSDIINGSGESLSFIKVSDIYREEENTLLRLGKIKEADKLRNKIPNLFELINDFFKDTNKTIQIDTSKNIYFKLEDKRVELKQLSAGEKQLLLILFSVFIQQEKPFILMMDEPEISLHIRWQQKLISTIRDLNPNCQLIIATHSPSIFGDGYGDKLFWMEKLWL
jgi:ABC-type lipoprotein export system ATPase subunit